MINLIPMAGRGNRFIQQMYRVSKPFVPVMNYPMVVSALKSFPKASKYIFVCRKEHYNKLKKITDSFEVQSEIIVVDKITEGQACTCFFSRTFFTER
ncbi:hypothetical protein ACFL4O_00945 [bacterium]